VLEVSQLTYAHGTHVAIEDVSFAVPDGQLVAIVGPSGSGKSTLLRCIAGLLRTTGGQVVLNGLPVTRVPDGLAVVFQDYSRSLYPWLSVRDNVALPLLSPGVAVSRGRARRENRPSHRAREGVAAPRVSGRQLSLGWASPRIPRKQRRQRAMDALAVVGLADAAGKYPWQLSGGMQQRAAIARALACDPVLLLMDEPFGSVDAQTREDLQDLILRVRAERNITILLVTHDIDESVYVGDRVLVLTHGPGRVRADLRVDLPAPRDQITTKETREFAHLRAEVSRLVRGAPAGPPTARSPTTRPPTTPPSGAGIESGRAFRGR
jgi:NitT/TauT family transport system ATP-binding protein